MQQNTFEIPLTGPLTSIVDLLMRPHIKYHQETNLLNNSIGFQPHWDQVDDVTLKLTSWTLLSI